MRHAKGVRAADSWFCLGREHSRGRPEMPAGARGANPRFRHAASGLQRYRHGFSSCHDRAVGPPARPSATSHLNRCQPTLPSSRTRRETPPSWDRMAGYTCPWTPGPAGLREAAGELFGDPVRYCSVCGHAFGPAATAHPGCSRAWGRRSASGVTVMTCLIRPSFSAAFCARVSSSDICSSRPGSMSRWHREQMAAPGPLAF